jgi:hypothetical protein
MSSTSWPSTIWNWPAVVYESSIAVPGYPVLPPVPPEVVAVATPVLVVVAVPVAVPGIH